MAGSVVLQTPVLWLGCGLALLLCLLGRRGRGALTILSAALGVLTTAAALLLGASTDEAVCLLLALLLLQLPAFRRKGEGT